MSALEKRLRRTLRPDYELERELASGGMGTVFLARDVKLAKRVAVKLLRPELATARAAERFRREAQVLAQLSHPHVVPVHDADERDGLAFYVMDYLEGQTLADRLARGPLPPHDALKLGRDLLDALEAAHRLGVVHRDVKPGNVFLVEGRAVLADFGIARAPHDGGTTTGGGQQGTVGYMPPEQAFGWAISPRTDLYAAAMVIYEAYTGRRWSAMLPDQKPDWSGVPRRVMPVLRRALAWDPADRWPDARTFRRALWRTRTRKYRRRTLLLTLGGLVAGAGIVWTLMWLERPTSAVALLPFVPGAGIDPTAAENLRTLTRINLEGFARVAHTDDVEPWWRQRGAVHDSLTGRDVRALRAAFAAWAEVAVQDGDTVVHVRLLDRRGRRIRAGAARLAGGLGEAAHQLGHLIVRQVAPEREVEYRGFLRELSDSALNAFLDGLRAFGRNAFATAVEHFAEARRMNPDFALADWWSSNAWRWNLTGEPHPDVDLHTVIVARGAALPELDSLLIEAQLAPDQRTRLAVYREALARYPRNGYAAFLYAEELQSRGPFVGVGLDASTAALERAAELDSTFAPTLYHLVWAYLRLARAEDARRVLARLVALSAPREEGRFYQPPLLRYAMIERFAPDSAPGARAAILGDPDDAAGLRRVYRLTAMLGLPHALAELGGVMARTAASPAERGDAYEARGLGRVALGRIADALLDFDSAAAALRDVASRLEAAEWRVVGAALGLPGITVEARDAGRGALEAMLDGAWDTGHGARGLQARIRWALGLDAAAQGDPAAAARRREALRALEPDSSAERLGVLLDVARAGLAGDHRRGLALSEALLPYDSAGRGGEPFARAALHLFRAAWLDTLGRHAAADSARLWYEHFDFRIPQGPAGAAEIDWALAPYARWLRAERAAARGDRRAACRHYAEIPALWAEADSAYEPLRARAVTYLSRHCTS